MSVKKGECVYYQGMVDKKGEFAGFICTPRVCFPDEAEDLLAEEAKKYESMGYKLHGWSWRSIGSQ